MKMLSRIKNLFLRYGAAGALKTLCLAAARGYRARFGRGTRPDAARTAELCGRIFGTGRGPVLLFRGSGGYATPLFQRPQQLARALAAKGCVVLYEASPLYDAVRLARMEAPGLWLVNLRSRSFGRAVLSCAESSGRPLVQRVASPERSVRTGSVEELERRGWRLFYDYIDAISPEISASRRVPRAVLAMFAHAMSDGAALVVCSSEALLRDAVRRHAGDNALVENGVDQAHFSSPGPCPDDPVFRAILRRGRPRLCFYGALASWLDYDALRLLAGDGRFDLILIGSKYDGSFDARLAGAQNVFFLGAKPYQVLKDYASRCDVMLVPFRKGRVGDAASPVKLFEYMALSKPIVASDTAECRRCRSPIIAASPEDWPGCVLRALERSRDPAFLTAVRAEALAADWGRRAEALLRALGLEAPAAK